MKKKVFLNILIMIGFLFSMNSSFSYDKTNSLNLSVLESSLAEGLVSLNIKWTNNLSTGSISSQSLVFSAISNKGQFSHVKGVRIEKGELTSFGDRGATIQFPFSQLVRGTTFLLNVTELSGEKVFEGTFLISVDVTPEGNLEADLIEARY